jgi:hypothetical protein
VIENLDPEEISIKYDSENETHLAIAKAAGYNKWDSSAGAEITKMKAGDVEQYNHYFNNKDNVEVTPEMVLDQVKRYNNPNDNEGHLYGAIIASLREYIEATRTGKYAEHYLAFCAHYIGDLSQPLHNIQYDDFNKAHHVINDGIVEAEVSENIPKIKRNIYPIILRPENFKEDLAKEIARIANISRQLGIKP